MIFGKFAFDFASRVIIIAMTLRAIKIAFWLHNHNLLDFPTGGGFNLIRSVKTSESICTSVAAIAFRFGEAYFIATA